MSEQQAPEARLTIEDDGLGIHTSDGVFHLPKEAVDPLVVTLILSGFGPQTAEEFAQIMQIEIKPTT